VTRSAAYPARVFEVSVGQSHHQWPSVTGLGDILPFGQLFRAASASFIGRKRTNSCVVSALLLANVWRLSGSAFSVTFALIGRLFARTSGHPDSTTSAAAAAALVRRVRNRNRFGGSALRSVSIRKPACRRRRCSRRRRRLLHHTETLFASLDPEEVESF